MYFDVHAAFVCIKLMMMMMIAFICVFFMFCFILHTSCIIVSVVGWT